MNDPCGIVLYPLQLVDGARWSTMEHSVAVVDPGKDKTTCEHPCEVSSQQCTSGIACCADTN